MHNLDHIQRLIPSICQWAEEQEQLILSDGEPLTADQQIDAYLAGVKTPHTIRVQYVEQIPFPKESELLSILNTSSLLTPATVGLCLRKGIYIKSSYQNNRRVLVHELAHTMQYERLGSIQYFLEQYIREYILYGYPYGSLELEATELERKICGVK